MFSHISLSVSLFLSLSINVCLSLHYSCIYLFFCLLSIALSSYLSIPPSIIYLATDPSFFVYYPFLYSAFNLFPLSHPFILPTIVHPSTNFLPIIHPTFHLAIPLFSHYLSCNFVNYPSNHPSLLFVQYMSIHPLVSCLCPFCFF